mmetsp:Transcript_49744/g.144331  ORF Transcript_49744/g.144331 Transcript_49744/m.144331 type:complete len:417 (-) Transcript_49744:86-1336(-)
MADFEERIRKLRSIAQASAEKVMMRELTVPPQQALPAIPPVLSLPDFPPPTATPTTPAAKKPRLVGPDVVMAVPDVANGFAIPDPPPGPAPFTVVKVPDSLVGLLIGKSGSGLKHLEAENFVNITVGKLVEGGHRRVCIEGEPSCQTKAAQMIEHFVGMKEAQDAVKQVMTKQVQCQEILRIPERLVGLMIGKRGENITRVRDRFGINTQFEKENTLGDVRILTLSGQAENVAAAKEQVELMLLQFSRRDGIFNEHLETKYGNRVGLSTNTAPPPPPPLTMQTGREMPGADGCSFEAIFKSPFPPPPSTPPPPDLAPAVQPPGPDAATLAQFTPVMSPWPEQLQGTPMQNLPGAENDPHAAAQLAAHYEALLPWAAHYARDPACVAYYQQLKVAAAEAAAVAVPCLAMPNPWAGGA